MPLSDYRQKLDEIDKTLVALFHERMAVAADIARVKQQEHLPVFDPAREREKLADVARMSQQDLAGYAQRLYGTLFELSRSYQRSLNQQESPLQRRIRAALEDTPRLLDPRALVACQGVEGAYSQIACEKLFAQPSIMYFSSFEGVCRAVDQGLCRYGVLPLENSTAGSVNRIYDLMMSYNFSIVRSTRVKWITALALPGARVEDIREVISTSRR